MDGNEDDGCDKDKLLSEGMARDGKGGGVTKAKLSASPRDITELEMSDDVDEFVFVILVMGIWFGS